jgi:stage II sporulation protein D
MKKLVSSLVFIGLFLFAAPILAQPMIRVGLTNRISESPRVAVSGAVLEIGFEENGQYHERALIHGSAFAFTPNRGFYVRLGNLFASYEQAMEAAVYNPEAAASVPCYIGDGLWVLYFGPFADEAEAMAFAATMVTHGDKTVVTQRTRRIALESAGEVILLLDSPSSFPQVSVPNEEIMTIGGARYRGRVELGRYQGNNITGVNVLPIDEYLYSVVVIEIGSGSHVEALKAQAVAARTFARYRISTNRHAAAGYNLCDTTCCQVYIGVNNEVAHVSAAVRDTSGIMIYHDNRPIEAYFSASSGGHTDSSENVWFAALPYARGVPEKYDEPLPANHIWTRTFTYAELTAIAAANNINVGTVTGIRVARTANDRAQELVIEGTLHHHSLVREEIRRFFAPSPGGWLMSRNFTLTGAPQQQTQPQRNTVFVEGADGTVESDMGLLTVLGGNGLLNPLQSFSGLLNVMSGTGLHFLSPTVSHTPPPPVSTGTVTISGRGNGHGVGMSQIGARGMAERGYTFDEILRWYYTGVEVR